VHNLLRIMSLEEDSAMRTVFVNAENEGGINTIYDPKSDSELYQVFIHNNFPLVTENSWVFPTYEAARSFAAERFNQDWEMLSWDGAIHRKCEREDCGERKDCHECQTGGGCKSCGALDDFEL